MKKDLIKSINLICKEFKQILSDNLLSIYIYGSCVLDDFKLGWSDIDILVLTKNTLKEDHANKLLTLRQDMLKKFPQNKYFKSFEGAILSADAFINRNKTSVVYWGTKGEKIKDCYSLDSFSMKELIESGELLYGEDIRNQLKMPTYEDLKHDIIHHYQTIREHAQITGRNLYSFGWFLDISRCIYTVKTGEIISKTKAGEWAIKNNICPYTKLLKNVLKIRNNPLKYKNRKEIMDWAETLGNYVQDYADVLEEYLNKKRT